MLASIAFTLVAAQGPVTLRYTPPIGKAFRYRYTMAMEQAIPNVGPMNMKTAMDMSIKAIARTGNVTTVESRTSNAKVTLPANNPLAARKAAMEKQMGSMVLQSQISSLYEIIRVVNKSPNQAGMASANSQMMGSMSGMKFPGRPIRVGETWTVSMDMGKVIGQAVGNGMQAKGNIPIKLKLVSVQGSTARVSLSMSGNTTMSTQGQQVKMTTQGSGWTSFELATGVLREMQMQTTNKITAGQMGMTQKISQTMKRL